MRVEFIGIETGNALDAASFRAQATPKTFAPSSNTRDRTDAGNDCATSSHIRLLR
jgi:hypothetical protein